MVLILFRLLIPLVVIAVGLWFFWESRAPAQQRILNLLRRREFERAYLLASRHGQEDLVRNYLEDHIELPSVSLRSRILAAFTELASLRNSVYDEANTYVNDQLLKAMRESADEARSAFWDICVNLEVVARQKVRFSEDHPKIKRLAHLLEQLADSTGLARVKLAELSLGAKEREVQEAKDAIVNVRRQSEALLEIDGMLDLED